MNINVFKIEICDEDPNEIIITSTGPYDIILIEPLCSNSIIVKCQISEDVEANDSASHNKQSIKLDALSGLGRTNLLSEYVEKEAKIDVSQKLPEWKDVRIAVEWWWLKDETNVNMSVYEIAEKVYDIMVQKTG